MVWECESHRVDNVHGWRNKSFIAKEPYGDSHHVEFITNLSVIGKAPHPGGVCMDRFQGGIFKEWMDNFEVVEHCMDV